MRLCKGLWAWWGAAVEWYTEASSGESCPLVTGSYNVGTAVHYFQMHQSALCGTDKFECLGYVMHTLTTAILRDGSEGQRRRGEKI